MLPQLYLASVNDSFPTKHLALPPGQRVKIARQPNNKTPITSENGFFDSKVLSRQHAEVWEEEGKIFIKDVKVRLQTACATVSNYIAQVVEWHTRQWAALKWGGAGIRTIRAQDRRHSGQ